MIGPGAIFDGAFRIEQELGEGGFATVYSALDPQGRRVALKILRPNEDGTYDEAARGRFRREIDIVGRLRSAHTVRLLGAGEAATGDLYAVFELVPGRDLAALLAAAGRLQPRWVVHIMKQLLDALGEAHRLGLLHRDIKPENVRVFEAGDDPMVVKLLDFGIARGTDDGHPSITKTGELIGTPRYMSPEQLMGQPLTPASDLYSLGVMMFELALGREVMGANSWGAQLERLQSGHVLAFPEMSRLGPGLHAVLQRLTARRPEQRFHSAGAVLAALENIERDAPVEVSGFDETHGEPRPPGTSVATPDPRGRAVLAVAVALLALIAVVIAAVVSSPPPAPPKDVRQNLGELLKSKATPAPPAAAKAVVDAGTSPEDARLDDADRSAPLPPEDPRGGTEGCGEQPPFTGFGTLNMHASYVPTGYRPNYKHPIILLLHQDAEPAGELLAVSGFERHAEPDHFVVVAPEYPTIVSAWRDDWDDEPIVRGAYQEAAELLCLDPDRVFVVGNSQGGRTAHFLSCRDWVAGIGTFAFGSGNTGHHCPGPDPPKPIVIVTPRNSPHVPFHGGLSCTSRVFKVDDTRVKFSVAEIERFWRERNGCTDDAPQVRTDGPHACYTWNCDTLLRSCHVDGGHGWPGSASRAIHDNFGCDGPPPTDFDAAREFWDAFRQIGVPDE